MSSRQLRIVTSTPAFSGNCLLSCAAITARRAGARVIVLERSPRDFRGGNSRHTRNFRCLHATTNQYQSGTYTENEIVKKNPFASIDQTGVGQLVQIACEKGNKTRPGIKLGICGEHGGDPDSVKFCHKVGLTYVSCSPYRVPVARLAAAQAAIEEKRAAAKAKKK